VRFIFGSFLTFSTFSFEPSTQLGKAHTASRQETVFTFKLAKISNRLLRRTFNGHVPDAWPIPPEDVRQLVGLAHHDALLAGAAIHVSQRGIEITMPEAPQD